MTKPKTELVPISSVTDRLDSSEEIKLGQWYWLNVDESETKRKKIVKKLCCVMHVGSNYAELKTAAGDKYHSRSSWRVHFNEWDGMCTFEPTPELFIRREIESRHEKVKELLGEVQRVTAQLGIVPREALADESIDASRQALAAVSGTANVDAHKKALILAKKETLPELFKQIEDQHKRLAVWMDAETLPARAQFGLMKQSISSIDDRIFTVELYAGLVEKLEQVKDGAPASNDTKVTLFQRRHYMDEECLAHYEAGGMDYKSIRDFEKWLAKPGNFGRILPMDRSIVAFQVRRRRKEREGYDLSDWVRIIAKDKADKGTFLYIRNGEQLWVMYTEIDFDEQLFPDAEHEVLLGAHTGDLWANVNHLGGSGEHAILTDAQYHGMLERHAEAVAKFEREDAEYKRLEPIYKKALKAYEKAFEAWQLLSDFERESQPKPEKPTSPMWPGFGPHLSGRWEKVTQESTHYDDVMQIIGKMTRDHNRVATVLQGLLDRSPCLHPHPPWRIWTSEGFQQGINLIYDDSRALVSGDPPSFEAYRDQLNQSIKVGDYCVGQQIAWEEAEAVKYNERQDRRDRRGHRTGSWEPTRYKPHGNPGPGDIAKVVAMGRNGDCIFEWERQYKRRDSYYSSDEPILTRFRCPRSKLLNVSAYTAGDFKIFFADPRTRADYLEWAPYLIPAEDFAVLGKHRTLDQQDQDRRNEEES